MEHATRSSKYPPLPLRDSCNIRAPTNTNLTQHIQLLSELHVYYNINHCQAHDNHCCHPRSNTATTDLCVYFPHQMHTVKKDPLVQVLEIVHGREEACILVLLEHGAVAVEFLGHGHDVRGWIGAFPATGGCFCHDIMLGKEISQTLLLCCARAGGPDFDAVGGEDGKEPAPLNDQEHGAPALDDAGRDLEPAGLVGKVRWKLGARVLRVQVRVDGFAPWDLIATQVVPFVPGIAQVAGVDLVVDGSCEERVDHQRGLLGDVEALFEESQLLGSNGFIIGGKRGGLLGGFLRVDIVLGRALFGNGGGEDDVHGGGGM